MGVVLKNNAFATTVIAASSSDTALVLKAGTGANFPATTGGDYFYLTIANGSSAPEVVKCTAKSGDILTVVRAQEGTAAQAIPAGSIVELRVTAQSVIDAINNRLVSIPALNNFADDTAAAAGGIAIGALYRTGSAVKVRVT